MDFDGFQHVGGILCKEALAQTQASRPLPAGVKKGHLLPCSSCHQVLLALSSEHSSIRPLLTVSATTFLIRASISSLDLLQYLDSL